MSWLAQQLEVDDFRVAFVQVVDDAAVAKALPFKKRLHGQIGLIGRSEQLRRQAGLLHVPQQSGADSLPPEVGMNIEHPDETVAKEGVTQHAICGNLAG